MTILQSTILGIVQGIGEFLPISSSAHLVILPFFCGWDYQGLSYDVMLHMGTLLAIVLYFYKDWLVFIRKGLTKPKSRDGKFFWLLVIATFPAGIAGLLLKDLAATTFRDPLWIAFNLAFFAIILYIADRKSSRNKIFYDLNLKGALLIGFFQALAIMPGTSRSGITITAALLLGFKREDAAKISFFLAMPIIFGAGLVESRHFSIADINTAFIVGLLVSFIAGWLSIKFLLNFLKNHSVNLFVMYRVILAGIILFTALS
ncbi:MAG: undecaprenyl-diphosphate phosphatase [Elusimicrobiota bacterium]|nr:undecaprenyl-diphosphate phosphatase [Elusimicrobiota bacterium]